MTTWGIPFHVIENEWTDEQFFMFVDRLGERLEREEKASNPKAHRGRSSASAGRSRDGEAKSIGIEDAIAWGKEKARAQVNGD